MQKLAARTQFEWGDFRILLAVHREGGLVGAASKLGLDATTVARRIRHLAVEAIEVVHPGPACEVGVAKLHP
jgi:hypothetical protein